jgi:hypothetical protein
MIAVDDDYTREADCDYKEERYTARDNGVAKSIYEIGFI